jgi:hypothetical protein
VLGWISKLGGLVTKISGEKRDSISGPNDVASVSNQGGQTVSGRTVAESDRDLLEAMDDNMEQWGGSEGYRKEDRFFGSLQGGAYQRTRDSLPINNSKSNPLQVRRARLTGSSTYSTAQEYLHGMTLSALDERINTNIHLSVLLNCRKALVSILLRSMVQKDIESKDDKALGKDDLRELPYVMSALILSSIGFSPLPLNGSIEKTVVTGFKGEIKASAIANGEDIKEKELMSPISDDTGELRLSVPQGNGEGLGGSLQPPLTNDLDVEWTIESANVIAQKLVLFIRLVTFRGDPYYVSGLEYLGVDDITAAGTQLKSLTMDMILGPLLIAILKSNKYNKIEKTCIEDIKVQRINSFVTALRDELLHSIVGVIAGKDTCI